MKTENINKNHVGVTQEEIALFLGVTRSQWSMYCIGKRKLPIEATQKLAQLLGFLQKESAKPTKKASAREQKKRIEKLEKIRIETELQLFSNKKKLELYQKKLKEIEISTSCVAFFKTQKGSKAIQNQIEIRISKESQMYNETNCMLLKDKIVQLEVLQKSMVVLLKKVSKT